ncbi:MAG: T9SS type A sorting domain-containing protein [candidate division Zixibacteria bacterium]|nr:T9SS type A sorting domain-containing protein [candidate division Zixibacteria bacterium]
MKKLMLKKCLKITMFLLSSLLALSILSWSDEGINKESTTGNLKAEFFPSAYDFIWGVISSGGNTSSGGSYKMLVSSAGQIFTGKSQGGNYIMHSGYISTPAPRPVDVESEEETPIPKSYNLSQNYPNPFNPSTVIEYSLPKGSEVKIIVYNVLGQKVKTLMDEYQNVGIKTVHWDGMDDNGEKVASGIYFYRLKTGDYSEAKKMVLLR